MTVRKTRRVRKTLKVRKGGGPPGGSSQRQNLVRTDEGEEAEEEEMFLLKENMKKIIDKNVGVGMKPGEMNMIRIDIPKLVKLYKVEVGYPKHLVSDRLYAAIQMNTNSSQATYELLIKIGYSLEQIDGIIKKWREGKDLFLKEEDKLFTIDNLNKLRETETLQAEFWKEIQKLEQAKGEDIEAAHNAAKSKKGATLKDLENARTSSDFIEIYKQLNEHDKASVAKFKALVNGPYWGEQGLQDNRAAIIKIEKQKLEKPSLKDRAGNWLDQHVTTVARTAQ